MVTRISISSSDLKDLFRGKIVYKDMRTGPIEISLSDIGFPNMRDLLEEAIDEKFPMQTFPRRRATALTGDDD
jgi:hypothetical protein